MTHDEIYVRISACLLALKAEGATIDQLAMAIIRAANEAGVKASLPRSDVTDWWQP